MSNWIFIIAMFLVGVLNYLIGLTRGIKETEAEHVHDYDEGYLAGYNDAVEEHKRGVKLNCLVNALDDLFKDDDEDVFDAGSY